MIEQGPAVPPTTEPGCEDPGGWLCDRVLEATDGNEAVAQAVDWVVGKPLTVVLILVGAWIVAKLARRLVRRLVFKTVTSTRSLTALPTRWSVPDGGDVRRTLRRLGGEYGRAGDAPPAPLDERARPDATGEPTDAAPAPADTADPSVEDRPFGPPPDRGGAPESATTGADGSTRAQRRDGAQLDAPDAPDAPGADGRSPDPRQLEELRRAGRAESIAGVLGSTATVLVWTVAVMMVVGELGIPLGPLIAGAGIGGVALGFGAQSLVKDVISGLFMLLEDQYGVGDVVDLGEAVGAVEQISLRATVLRSIDGTVWHVPNGEIRRVGNKSQRWSVALVDIDVAYSTDLETAQGVIARTAEAVCARPDLAASILDAPEVLGIEHLGMDGITVRTVVRTRPGDQWGVQRALRAALKQALDDAGIEIPFPQRTIWVRNDEE